MPGYSLGKEASIEPALVAQLDHFLNECLLLLVVQTRKQRLGGVGDVALIDGAVVEKLGFIAHLLDDVVGRIALGARDTQIEPVRAVVPR